MLISVTLTVASIHSLTQVLYKLDLIWQYMKSVEITNVIKHYPEEEMNVCIQCHCNPT